MSMNNSAHVAHALVKQFVEADAHGNDVVAHIQGLQPVLVYSLKLANDDSGLAAITFLNGEKGLETLLVSCAAIHAIQVKGEWALVSDC